MSSRALRVALLHLSQNEEVPEPTEETTEESFLDDSKVKEIASEALDDYYPALIEQFLRNLDFNELMAVAGYIVKTFHSSGTPLEMFTDKLKPLKTPLLRALEDIAKEDSESLKDTIVDQFKKEPTSDPEAVTDFTRSWLRGIVNKTKKKMNKIEKL
jgi:hypothetical protein